jgi:hypothetical protein
MKRKEQQLALQIQETQDVDRLFDPLTKAMHNVMQGKVYDTKKAALEDSAILTVFGKLLKEFSDQLLDRAGIDPADPELSDHAFEAYGRTINVGVQTTTKVSSTRIKTNSELQQLIPDVIKSKTVLFMDTDKLLSDPVKLQEMIDNGYVTVKQERKIVNTIEEE